MRRREKGDTPRQKLAAKAAATSLTADITLVHVTTAFRLSEILSHRGLRIFECKVFGRKLLYFFVHRPAFKPSHNDGMLNHESRYPCVLLLSTEGLAERPHHIYPFDTGGAVEGFFSERADPETYLEDYNLGAELRSAHGHIEWISGDIETYFEALTKTGLLSVLPVFEFEARSCVRMAELAIPSTIANQPDDRASAIEVAYSHDIRLKEHVKAIIVPHNMLEDKGQPNKEVVMNAKRDGVAVIAYEWKASFTAKELREEINRVVRHYLEDDGAIPVRSIAPAP